MWLRKRAFSVSSLPGAAVYVRISYTRPAAGACAPSGVAATAARQRSAPPVVFIIVIVSLRRA